MEAPATIEEAKKAWSDFIAEAEKKKKRGVKKGSKKRARGVSRAIESESGEVPSATTGETRSNEKACMKRGFYSQPSHHFQKVVQNE